MIMVFSIQNDDNHGSVVFDIDFWLEPFDHDVNLWHSAIRPTPVTDGVVDIVCRLIADGAENLDELKTDMREISDLYYWLCDESNASKPMTEAQERHNHVFLPHIQEVFERFCDKYGLYLNID